jgi:hypothetical protein
MFARRRGDSRRQDGNYTFAIRLSKQQCRMQQLDEASLDLIFRATYAHGALRDAPPKALRCASREAASRLHGRRRPVGSTLVRRRNAKRGHRDVRARFIGPACGSTRRADTDRLKAAVRSEAAVRWSIGGGGDIADARRVFAGRPRLVFASSSPIA